ncbi:MAG: dCMP deaminase family protein [Bacteroidetes bacterium]|nr:dCMP deaminase family protein [Bacteroidota bacterium]
MSDNRLSWEEYFLRIAEMVSERSTCNRAKIGAVIVRDRSILATGYNGSPKGHPHCTDVGCLIYTTTDPGGAAEENCFRTIHAEINAITQAAKNGTSIDGADIFITASPCYHCLKTLINCGIQRVYYRKPYKIDRIKALTDGSPIELIQVT